MTCDLPRYPKYRDSGVDWLQEVPEHWSVQRQGAVTRLLVSNVDKNTTDGESPVRLCNYVDVYKHERIRDDMPFMRATASEEEALRFRLVPGDVVITKDSETWDDIAVPALVESAGPDLVCGYHLAILRPNATRLLGSYLLRASQSAPVAGQYHVAANGVTRYGLSQNAIKTVLLPIPLLSEQAAIVRYLDHADRRIQHAIRAKKRLIALLNEEKAAIIHRAVTRGLDPSVPIKPSGVEWLGDIPKEWQVVRNGRLFAQRNETGFPSLPVLEVSLRTGVRVRDLSYTARKQVMSDFGGYKRARRGDLAYNMMRMWQGAVGIAPVDGLVSPAYVVGRPLPGTCTAYFSYLFRTAGYMTEVDKYSRGIVKDRNRLYWEDFKQIPSPYPPLEEQQRIVDAIDYMTARADDGIAAAEQEISLLREFRTRLISDVVTGKLDARQAAANLPDVGGDEDLAIEDDLANEEVNEDGDDLAEELAV